MCRKVDYELNVRLSGWYWNRAKLNDKATRERDRDRKDENRKKEYSKARFQSKAYMKEDKAHGDQNTDLLVMV